MELTKYINKERLVDTFIDLIKINSPAFGEREIGDYLVKRLKQTGCNIEINEYDRSFNIIASKKVDNSSKYLLLEGHMDTIEPTEGITYKIENEIIKTTGNTVLGADDKSALALIIEVLTVLEEKNIPHCNLEILFTSAEEKGLIGAKNLNFEKIRSKYAIVLDASGSVGNIIISSPTHHSYEMKVIGRSAHAGIEPEKGINAIRVAAKIITGVPDGRIDHETTANIGMISGGVATNVVPKEVVIRGEIRSQNNKTLEEIKTSIFEIAHKVASQESAKILITDQIDYHSFKIDKNEPFLIFLDNIFRECEIEPIHIGSGGGSDANILNAKGIKSINISTGMQNVHSMDEQISVADLFNGTLILLKAISEFDRF